MNKNIAKFRVSALSAAIGLVIALPGLMASNDAEAVIAATHIYHNHMPNFWPYYDTSTYASTAVGAPIRYTYDGGALAIKNSPPAGYKYFLADGKTAMPHDNLNQYYDRDAKRNAYTVWPAQTARANSSAHPQSQTHVTMSAAVINNVQDFAERGTFSFFQPGWSSDWKSTVGSLKTKNGFNALDPIHFTGHHSMGPLVGPDYFLKDLIYQNVTLQQDYFLGSQFKSSKGFFPTELGFSERLIPTLKKLGIEWSVMGNNHFSRTLKDYPYDYKNPSFDTLVSPPNRADLQNTYEAGGWEKVGMAHEQQQIVNKFPFCNIPHWVQYVNPETGEVSKIAGIPVDQNGSWLEGWEGQANAANEIDRPSYEKDANGRTMYFVIAHDGDNGEGRAGSISTWLASGGEYSTAGVVGMGVDEYLKTYPIPEDDIQHVQDGSWVDTRDSSSDPDWYHWHIPMGVWKGQFADFNKALGTEFEVPTNFDGTPFGHAVSMEYGYHYLERNFAILQASLNYAKTAEQIWLDSHPNYWKPTTDAQNQVTYSGNQLNPYMFSYPVKGDESNDYKGGANPAELAWYFLIASIDSGFGYYDENQDDNVKPTLGFNQSLFFSEPYVSKNIAKDKTGPSMWWVQRYPTNPGSANSGKAEGWTKVFADNTWAAYTYAYDVSGIKDVTLYVRAHKAKSMSATDIAPRVYNPKAFAGKPNVNVNQVGEWKAYKTTKRDLTPDMNGVAWQDNAVSKNYDVLPAKKIGSTYYAYISDYRDQLVDYYMEATDNLGNVTRSEINHAYIGAGRYTQKDGAYIEDVNGDVEGTHMFFSDGKTVLTDKVVVYAKPKASDIGSVYVDYKDSGSNDWTSTEMSNVKNSGYFKTTVTYTRDSGCADIRIHNNGENSYYPSNTGKCLSKGTYTVSQDGSVTEGAPTDIPNNASIYFKPSASLTKACIHYRGTPGTESDWTKVPGEEMDSLTDGWFKKDVNFDSEKTGVEFLFNDCGSNWYKNSNGGNFTINTVHDVNISGTSLKDGIPEQFDTANKAPVALINASATSVSAGTAVTLDASASTDKDGSIVSYKWSTGETGSKITVEPTETTTYTVTVTDNNGATSSKSVVVEVSSNNGRLVLIPDFTTKTDGLTVSFEDASDIKNTSDSKDPWCTEQCSYEIDGWDWDFGDGTSGSGKNVSHTYAKAGSYKVTLKSYFGKGKSLAIVDTKTATVTVSASNDVPVEALIEASKTSIKAGETVTLNAAGSKGNGVTYLWNTGATTPSITVAPSATTTYSVTVTDKNEKTSQANVTINVQDVVNHAPSAAIVSSASGSNNVVVNGNSVVLDASSSTDQDGDKLTYKWSTGETTAKITVKPEETTSYTVTVTDPSGAESVKSVQITVIEEGENVPPVAKLSLNNFSVELNETFMIRGIGTDDKAVAKYVWSVDGVEVASGMVTTLDYTFTTEGEHVIALTVSDEEGLSSTAEAKVTVLPADASVIEAAIEGPQEVTALTKVQFSATGSKSDAGISTYSWDVDGEKLLVSNPVLNWAFTSAGSHVVTVTATDSNGISNSASMTVMVKGFWDEDNAPDFTFGANNEIDDSQEINIVTSDDSGYKAPLKAVINNLVSLVFEKMDMLYSVYKVEDGASSQAVSQTADNLKLCRVSNGVVDCGTSTGDDQLKVTKGNSLDLTFKEAGNYRVYASTQSANGTTEMSGYIPVSVAAKAQTTDPTNNTETDADNTNNESSNTTTSNGGGKKSGGAFDPLALLGLALGAVFMRRRNRK